MADKELDTAQDLENERTPRAGEQEQPVRRGQQDADDDEQFDDEDEDLEDADDDIDNAEGPQGATPS
jgi:hypothetical protein